MSTTASRRGVRTLYCGQTLGASGTSSNRGGRAVLLLTWRHSQWGAKWERGGYVAYAHASPDIPRDHWQMPSERCPPLIVISAERPEPDDQLAPGCRISVAIAQDGAQRG